MNNTDMKELVRTHSRRRHPKRYGFLKGMIIYSVLMLAIISVLVAVGWKYASLRDEMLPERAVEKLIADNSVSGWRQLLLTELPKTYPAYEDGERLAREVLADRLDVGRVTYLRYAATDKKKPVFLLLDGGRPMADVTLAGNEERLFGMSDWKVESITFRQSYFEALGVDFKTVTVAAFEGSDLTVNGTQIDRSAAKTGGRYPALLPCEEARSADVPCDIYTLEGIYYEPEISATLNGVSLAPLVAADGTRYFAPAEGMTRSASVTVPAGVAVSFNGLIADGSWAELSYTEGKLGELDVGGSGVPQMLEVWSVSGLFFEPEIAAQYAGKTLTLLSEANGAYIFDTPDECRFTLVVIAPPGAVVSVNGKPLDASSASPGGASLDDLAYGATLVGLYGTSGFAANSITPAFDKYTVTGFLAHPTVTATLDGAALPLAGDRVDGYFITAEFDIPAAPPPADPAADADLSAALSAASGFAEGYFGYISVGGEMGKNHSAFDASYSAFLESQKRGTPAFLRTMASYAEVYRAPAYSGRETERLTAAAITKYAENCISVEEEYSLLLKKDAAGDNAANTAEAETGRRSGTLKILLIKQGGTWEVLSYLDSPAGNQTEPAP